MENKLLPAILMSLLSIVCILLVIQGLKKAINNIDWTIERKRIFLRRGIASILIWVVLISILAITGFFSDLSSLPPKPPLLILIALFALIGVSFFRSFTQLIKVVPPYWLVYAQSFRILVEFILWLSYTQHLLPKQMTFEGYNFDVVSGILALPVGYIMQRFGEKTKPIGIVYNVIGLLLLINILIIAVLSMPTPFRYFMNEPSNTIIGEFPFIFLPGVLVVLAIALHIFSLRQLFLKTEIKSKEEVTFAV